MGDFDPDAIKVVRIAAAVSSCRNEKSTGGAVFCTDLQRLDDQEIDATNYTVPIPLPGQTLVLGMGAGRKFYLGLQSSHAGRGRTSPHAIAALLSQPEKL